MNEIDLEWNAKDEVDNLSKKVYGQFIRSFLRQPRQVGSVIPSSRHLSARMTNAVAWHEVSAVAELGSGTGAITRVLKRHTTENMHVLLFEMDEAMRSQLKQDYPDFQVHANAGQLTDVLSRAGLNALDCIISGLPFFNFPPALRMKLLDQVHQALRPGGQFIAFQYSLQMKKLLSEKFILEQIGFVPLNFPPAFVYVCRKK